MTSGAVAQTPAQVHLARLRAGWPHPRELDLALSDKAASSDLRGYSPRRRRRRDDSASRVKALHAAGSIVLAYLSIGTIEDGRWWSAAA